MRVMIVDDHQLLRSALRTYVEDSFDNTTTEVCRDLSSAIEKLTQGPAFDVVLLDLGLPGEEGISALKRMRARFPDLDVIVLTGNTDEAMEDIVLREGAKAYVRKDANPTEIRDAIDVVVKARKKDGAVKATAIPQGREQWSPGTPAGIGAAAPNEQGVPFPSLALTPRQRDVASLLMQGKTSKEIALELGLAEQTVKQHSQVIFQLLGVRNRTEAAIKLRERFS